MDLMKWMLTVGFDLSARLEESQEKPIDLFLKRF